MRILVTGSSGYIGSYLCNMLANREDVEKIYAFDNLIYSQGHLTHPVYASHEKIEFYKSNILSFNGSIAHAVEDSDIIFPLAAIVGAPACDKHSAYAKALNLEWISTLAKRINENQLVIYPNTNSGYGSVGDGLCTEETPSNPISLYGKLKQDAEDILLASLANNSICFRLATVFGWSFRPRLDLLINNLTLSAFFDKEIEVFDGHFRRNYVHVKDVCRAFSFAIDNAEKMKGQTYNLGNDAINMTKKDLARSIGSVIGCKVFETDTRTDPDKRDYLVSSQKLYDLGYSPSMPLERGVTELAAFYFSLPKAKALREIITSPMYNY